MINHKVPFKSENYTRVCQRDNFKMIIYKNYRFKKNKNIYTKIYSTGRQNINKNNKLELTLLYVTF